jgi:hypothetical protein
MVTPGFLRLESSHSTISTICVSCFRRVLQSGALAELAAAERDHVCAQFDLGLLHVKSLPYFEHEKTAAPEIPWKNSAA